MKKFLFRLCIVYFFLGPFILLSGGPDFGITLLVSLIVSAVSFGLQYAVQAMRPKPPQVEVNKTGTEFQGSEYGTMIPRVYGDFGPVGGQIIHAFPLPFTTYTTSTPSTGGKHPQQGQITYHYRVTLAVLLVGNQVKGIRKILANEATFYVGTTTGDDMTIYPNSSYEGNGLKYGSCGSVTIHVGKPDQVVDATLEAYHGAGNVPRYQDCAYVVIKDLELDPFYNRIPQLSFFIENEDKTISTIIAKEFALSGIDESEYDLSLLGDEAIGGLIITQQAGVRTTVLEPISVAKQVDFVGIDGKITALPRHRQVEVEIPWEDLGYTDDDSTTVQRVQTARRQDQDIPSHVDVVYCDLGRDFEKNTQSYRRQQYDTPAQISITQTGYLALTANEASRIAKVVGVTAWTERDSVQFTLPPKYLIYTNGTIARLRTYGGRELIVIFEKMEFGLPGGAIKVSARTYLPEAYDQVGEGEVGASAGTATGPGDGGGGWQTVATDGYDYVQQPMEAVSMVSYVQNLDLAQSAPFGFYAWAQADPNDTRPWALWEGAEIWANFRGQGTKRLMATIINRGTFGKVYGPIQTAGVSRTNWIDTGYLDVDLWPGHTELTSIDQADFDNPTTLNLFVVGSEVIQARDVSKPDAVNHPDRYRLSYLRRGLRDTQAYVDAHAENEDCALIDGNMVFTPIDGRARTRTVTIFTSPRGSSNRDAYEGTDSTIP